MALKDSTAVIPETRRGAIDIVETRRKFNLKPDRIAAWIALLAGSILMLFPIFWLVTTSLKTKKQIFKFPPVWIPDPIRWQNYSDALRAQPFDRYAMNTLIITVASIFGVLLSSSLVAYAFARLRFPGRDVLFFLILSELMLPQTVTLIPRYIEFREFGWIDTWWPLIVPNYFGNAFFIFLLRQFFRTIPRELSDAAKVDGASEFRIFWQIILPLSRPALTVVAIFTFLSLERLPGAADLHLLRRQVHGFTRAGEFPRSALDRVGSSHGRFDDVDCAGGHPLLLAPAILYPRRRADGIEGVVRMLVGERRCR